MPLDAAVTAAIRVRAGVAVEDLADKRLVYDFVTFGNQAHVESTGGEFGDMVRVLVDVPDEQLDLSVKYQCYYARKITVRPSQVMPGVTFTRPVVLSFSNLCTSSASGDSDTEFAGFYEILANPPALESRLIPQIHKGGSGARQPFGDCFLGAMILL